MEGKGWDRAAAVVTWAMVALIAYDSLNRATGHTLARSVRMLWKATGTRPTPARVPSPAEVSQLLSEAARYTREAADNGKA